MSIFERGSRVSTQENEKTPKERCDDEIQALLASLDAEFTLEETTNALNRIFTPFTEVKLGSFPHVSNQLIKGLGDIEQRFGHDLVTDVLVKYARERGISISEKVA